MTYCNKVRCWRYTSNVGRGVLCCKLLLRRSCIETGWNWRGSSFFLHMVVIVDLSSLSSLDCFSTITTKIYIEMLLLIVSGTRWTGRWMWIGKVAVFETHPTQELDGIALLLFCLSFSTCSTFASVYNQSLLSSCKLFRITQNIRYPVVTLVVALSSRASRQKMLFEVAALPHCFNNGRLCACFYVL